MDRWSCVWGGDSGELSRGLGGGGWMDGKEDRRLATIRGLSYGLIPNIFL